MLPTGSSSRIELKLLEKGCCVRHIVDISDGKVTDNIEDEFITYSLGSCIGVTVYDETSKIGGMLHFQLPSSRLKNANPDKSPYMFADSGMLE